MRNGYEDTLTFDDRLARGWFSAFEPQWRAICDVRLDGIRLGDTRPRRRTPSPAETRYESKFGEIMVAAHALARLGAASIDLTTSERPDLVATIDGARVGIEIAEIQPGAHKFNAEIDVNIELQAWLEANPQLRPTFLYLAVSRRPGRYAAAGLSKVERARVLDVLTDLLRKGDYRTWVLDGRNPLYRWPEGAALGYQVVVNPCPGEQGYIRFDDGAATFNPVGMTGPILAMLERKRELALGYDRTYPLWLILCVSEHIGIFTESLTQLGSQPPAIGPFERFIAHDCNSFATFTAASAAA